MGVYRVGGVVSPGKGETLRRLSDDRWFVIKNITYNGTDNEIKLYGKKTTKHKKGETVTDLATGFWDRWSRDLYGTG